LDHIVWIPPSPQASGVADDALITAQDDGVLLGFRLIKALLQEGYGNKSLGMTIITTNTQTITSQDVADPSHASIHGLVGTLAKEYRAWRIRLLDMEAGKEWPHEKMFAAPPDAQGNALVFRRGEWYRQQLIQFVPQKS
jgi:acyl transferase domain-containing protein